MAASSGFTLVELLVALFILALLAGLSWRGVDGIVRTRDASQERLERQLRLQSVIGQWETDLAELQDTGSVVPLRFDGASLRLTRRVAGGVQVVVWTLRDGAWTRWSGPAATTVQDLQESWLSSQQLLGNEPGNLKALQGIEGWQLYYWRKNGWTNAQSSGDVAEDGAAVAREQLPGGVRLQLGLGEGSGFAGTLIRDVQLAPQPSTAQGPA
ncbi:PulJ/GspJ family protein [Rivibacter subsaxonicus]|uniref:PulJ/GspJ family protein n=1 Tax=Rivibacter subsaxonicus TaxID=457575 RepID=UPI0024155BB6|nr:prepilin-type N-terminal cleavage/methylation domain-containing protein [Rivibacter subsaxonicus]